MANGTVNLQGILAPLTGIESATQDAMAVPFKMMGVQAPPVLPGPAQLVSRSLSQSGIKGMFSIPGIPFSVLNQGTGGLVPVPKPEENFSARSRGV